MITFSYPWPGPIIAVDLPNPNLGDSDQYENSANFGISMAGSVYSYIKTPTVRRFLLTVTKLSYSQFKDLKNLIYTANSSDIGYTDMDGIHWVGQFLNDPFEGRDTKNFQTITLEFKGILA